MAALEVPVFPLPDVVFFPDTVLPLHIFEPRYRQMIADCLAGDRRLAVVMLRPGWEDDYYGRPPVHPVAGAGQIIHTERLADGRYNILLDGQMRIRIEGELPVDRPYRVVRARRLADLVPESSDAVLAERVQALRVLYTRLLDALGQTHADVVGRLTAAGTSPGALADRIASAVVPDAGLRQRLLETTDVAKRLDLATKALGRILTAVGNSGADEDQGDD